MLLILHSMSIHYTYTIRLIYRFETSGAAVLPTKLLSAVQSTFSSVTISDEEVNYSCYRFCTVYV